MTYSFPLGTGAALETVVLVTGCLLSDPAREGALRWTHLTARGVAGQRGGFILWHFCVIRVTSLHVRHAGAEPADPRFDVADEGLEGAQGFGLRSAARRRLRLAGRTRRRCAGENREGHQGGRRVCAA